MTEPTPGLQTKVCPQCAEEVKSAALVCQFCHYEFATSVVRYRGDWRVLASEVDALSAGDDVSVEVDDERLQVLKAGTVAYEVPVADVTASGSTTDTRLHLPDGQTILLDWWAGEDGHRLRSALLRLGHTATSTLSATKSREARLMTVPAGVDRTCIHCGKVVDPTRKRFCNNCGEPLASEGEAYQSLVADNPPTIVRTYRGAQQADTAAAFQKDAAELAKYGYAPTTQSWAQGQWGCGAFLVALLLCFVVLGFLIFIYLLIVKPEGTLTVTYAKVAGPVREMPRADTPPSAPLTLSDRLAQLDAARTSGLLTQDEYDAKRVEVLKNL